METFGAVVKEGLCEFSGEKDKIFDLCLFKTSKSNGKFISLKQYIENMQDGQKDIIIIGSILTRYKISIIRRLLIKILILF